MTGVLKIWTGTEWVDAGCGSAPTIDCADCDAHNDGRYVRENGDTMTGQLNVPFFHSAGSATFGDTISAQGRVYASNGLTVNGDTAFVSVTGNTQFSGAGTQILGGTLGTTISGGPVTIGNSLILPANAPQADNHAVPKSYVDDAIADAMDNVPGVRSGGRIGPDDSGPTVGSNPLSFFTEVLPDFGVPGRLHVWASAYYSKTVASDRFNVAIRIDDVLQAILAESNFTSGNPTVVPLSPSVSLPIGVGTHTIQVTLARGVGTTGTATAASGTQNTFQWLFVPDVGPGLGSSGRQDVVPVAATTYAITAVDENKLLTFTAATTVTVTAPASLAIGTRIDLARLGAGGVNVVAGSGATVLATPSASLRATGSAASLIKTSATAWLLTGDLL